MTSSEYMTRKKFFIPKEEITRAYHRKGLPSNKDFLDDGDWGVIDDGD